MAIISSHLLNAVDGSHAGGVTVTLARCTDAGRETLFRAVTDAGGRLSETVPPEAIEPAARYELTVEVGPWWAARAGGACTEPPNAGTASPAARTPAGAPPVVELVLRLLMPDPDARYHLPLILAPHGCSIWWSAAERPDSR